MTIIAVRTWVLNDHCCSQDPGLEHNIEFRTRVLKFIIGVRTWVLTAKMTVDLPLEYWVQWPQYLQIFSFNQLQFYQDIDPPYQT